MPQLQQNKRPMNLFNKLLKPTAIASIHESHRPFRLKSFLRKVTVNFGGTKTKYKGVVINKPTSVARVVDKFFMKEMFREYGVPSFNFSDSFDLMPFPVVIKSKMHVKKAPHLTRVDSARKWLDISPTIFRGIDKKKYYWEQFIACDREFRVHVSAYKQDEVYATEKVSRGGKSWIKNLKTCTFVSKFDKPASWDFMVKNCKRVLDIFDLDIAGFDVSYDSKEDKFYIIEVNTACGMGDETRKAYTKELNKIALLKQFGI